MTTVDELRAQEEAARRAFEARTIGMRDEDGTQWTIAELRAAFDRHVSGDWKAPVNVLLPAADDLVSFCRAVEFFQGDRPKVTVCKPEGAQQTHVRVTSRGYQG
jgi:hypothetical protein